MVSKKFWLLVAVGLLVACEDGPTQTFSPNNGNTSVQNGYQQQDPWMQDGDKTWDFNAGTGDSEGRAKSCDEALATATVKQMVVQPILPDQNIAGIPLWKNGNEPMHVNDLLGKPTDGKLDKFCDPSGVYSDAVTYGAMEEIIVFINENTKLIESIYVQMGYTGELKGNFTTTGTSTTPIVIKVRDYIKIGDKQLKAYASKDEQANQADSWANHTRVNQVYRMLRETFFGAKPADFPANFNCIDLQLCDVIYSAPGDTSVPQNTTLAFHDSGISLTISPTGTILYMGLEPVRTAPFEVSAKISFTNSGSFKPPVYSSNSQPGCDVSLDPQLTWKNFQDKCVKSSDTKTLARGTYQTHTQRDAIEVAFNGVTFSTLRKTTQDNVIKDGEKPTDADIVYGINFTRSSATQVAEFNPAKLAAIYKTKLEARVRGLVASNPAHQFAAYTLTVPTDLEDAAQTIGELITGNNINWIPAVAADLQKKYAALPTDADRELVKDVLHPVFVVEPFVDAVMNAFTGGLSDVTGSVKRFLVTDNRKWSIGYAHFKYNNENYRLVLQYSLFYGALTSVGISRGSSEIDTIFNNLKDYIGAQVGQSLAYYTVGLNYFANPNIEWQNPIGLGAAGTIAVTGFNRQTKTVNITLATNAANGDEKEYKLTVPGMTIADQAGFSKQVEGERFEFVPAHFIELLGKETSTDVYLVDSGEVDAKNNKIWQIGDIVHYSFKGSLTLCPGSTPLKIAYGANVRQALNNWGKSFPQELRNCEIVFNYSGNGNVLTSVASLKNKVAIRTSDERATAAEIWQ